MRRAVALTIALLGCVGEGEPPFIPDMSYEPVTTVGGVDETNELLRFARPQFWLVDSSTVGYSDELIPGRVVVVDILTGDGWDTQGRRGAEGPGEVGGYAPWVSSVADTIKLLTSFGRIIARSLDGTLLYDSLLTRQNPGIALAGVARNARVTVLNEPRVGGTISLRFESPRLFSSVPIDTIKTEEQVLSTGVVALARGDLIAYTTKDGAVHTRDGGGRHIASRLLPWKPFAPTIDGSGRVWINVFGHVRGGANLVVLDRELNTLGRALIPGFRDAFGDYVISVEKDTFDVQHLTLSRLRRQLPLP